MATTNPPITRLTSAEGLTRAAQRFTRLFFRTGPDARSFRPRGRLALETWESAARAFLEREDVDSVEACEHEITQIRERLAIHPTTLSTLLASDAAVAEERAHVDALDERKERAKDRRDLIGLALATLSFHEARFALTGGAIRRIVYAATGRPNKGGAGWNTGFRRLVLDSLITSKDQPTVRGHKTFVLTDNGRKRLGAMKQMPRATDVDPDAWLADSRFFLRKDERSQSFMQGALEEVAT